MKDWKGNEIKEGHFIIFIRRWEKVGGSGMMTDGIFSPVSAVERKSCWLLLEEHKIEKFGERLGYKGDPRETKGKEVIYYLDTDEEIEARGKIDDSVIIAIKDVSDKEDVPGVVGEKVKKFLYKRR